MITFFKTKNKMKKHHIREITSPLQNYLENGNIKLNSIN